MPLTETLPVGTGCTQWDVWGTVARVVVTDPDRLDRAAEIVRAELAAVDAACSRFRADSEIGNVALLDGRPVRVSARLISLVRAALDAARDTDGDVDPTVGAAMSALGYDRDYALISDVDTIRDVDTILDGGEVAASATCSPLTVYPRADWRDVRIDGAELSVPAGVLLDLGATAKAWAADRAAALVAKQCDTGILVALGGDIATAGPAPEGWNVLVRDGLDEPACTIKLPAGAALATSSTISRSWSAGMRTLHHILDPRSGQPARRVWRTVSVAASSCVRANTLSTAAIVRGEQARRWLREIGEPARLVDADGTVTTLGGWPA